MKTFRLATRAAAACFAAAGLTMAYGAVARPGTVNYAEGSVNLDGQAIGAKALGSTEVGPGQVLQTAAGKAEMLLTPGVYLRLGDNSAVRMVSPSLLDTRVELLRGEANLEVDLLAKENRLDVLDAGARIHIEKTGIYSLAANPPLVAVYDGKAQVVEGDRSVELTKGREVAIQPNAALKAQKFDRGRQDPLYAWSKLRSQYQADANAESARMVVVNNYPGWWAGTGWYWNPWYGTWAFVPGAGYFANPWGFGFYSPAYIGVYGAPFYPGFHGRPVVVRGGMRAAVPAMGAMHAAAGGRVGFRGGRR